MIGEKKNNVTPFRGNAAQKKERKGKMKGGNSLRYASVKWVSLFIRNRSDWAERDSDHVVCFLTFGREKTESVPPC